MSEDGAGNVLWQLAIGFVSISLIAVGLILASGILLGQAAASGWLAVALTLGSTLFVWRSDRSPLWVLAAGGLAGAAFL
jgi:chromate transporter